MAQQVDFYLLDSESKRDWQNFLCRLVEKIYHKKHRVYLHAANKKDSEQIDEALWTYRDDSFVPHNLVGEGPSTTPPIQIGYDKVPDQQRDVLINLQPDTPSCFSQFRRILEIVPNQEEQKKAARKRYRYYREQNCHVSHHKISI